MNEKVADGDLYSTQMGLLGFDGKRGSVGAEGRAGRLEMVKKVELDGAAHLRKAHSRALLEDGVNSRKSSLSR